MKDPASQIPSSQRLMSVDALRGFDMFWIIGGDSLVYALNRMSQTPPISFLAGQLEHAEWQGFHAYDLIYPLFIFIMGISLFFSLSRTLERAGRAEALKRIFIRSMALYLAGFIFNGGLTNEWPDVRLSGVLGRIAIVYFFGGLLFCFFKPRALAAICVGLLAGYWALMTFVPIRDIQLERTNLASLAEQSGDTATAALFNDPKFGNPSGVKDSPAWAAAQRMFYATTNRVSGRFEPGLNLSDHLDFQYLPGMKYEVFADAEGYLSTIPAVASCLLGIFAGLLLQSRSLPDNRKVICLIVAGIACVVLGWLWNLQFPVIKKIWTSSFVLVAGGYSAILTGLFYLIVDVWQARKWCQPFVWMGMNSITIYMIAAFLGGFRKPAVRFVGGDVQTFFNTHVARGAGDMVVSLVGLALAFWLMHFMYRRKIFLRL
jgi:predicted acyltransferase